MGDVNKVNTYPDIMRKCFKMGLFKSEYWIKNVFSNCFFVTCIANLCKGFTTKES